MRKISGCLLSIAALAALLGCAQVPEPAPAPAATYRVGARDFALDGVTVLQTWPALPYRNPPSFARVAMQLPPGRLVPGLRGDEGDVVQIDLLAPQPAASADRILKANFTDWSGREAAPAGATYHYDPKSKLLKDGGRAVYRRNAAQVSGLEALSPPAPRGAAPEFFISRDGSGVAAAIDCREVPPAYGTGEYCSLRRQVGAEYGYRVLFRRDLLSDWQRIDAAARAYIVGAAQR
ncbi:hypothetical protein [Dongia sp.]|uniref:hypothetical protein n=1 Tax=Dongia sp. TaxID=1977262 RepID=UPI0035B400D8